MAIEQKICLNCKKLFFTKEKHAYTKYCCTFCNKQDYCKINKENIAIKKALQYRNKINNETVLEKENRLNKQKIASKKYYSTHQEACKNYGKEYYYSTNKKSAKKYYKKNKTVINKRSILWQKQHPEIKRKIINKRYANNQQYQIRVKVGNKLNKVIKQNGKTSKELGINYEAIYQYLLPQLEKFINLNLKFHIHHITPLSYFDLTNPIQLQLAFKPENHILVTPQMHKLIHKILKS